VGAHEIELAEVLKQAAKHPARNVVNAVQQSLRSQPEDVNMVLIVGGAGGLYRPALEEALPNVQFETFAEPVMANAVGFYRYGVATQ